MPAHIRVDPGVEATGTAGDVTVAGLANDVLIAFRGEHFAIGVGRHRKARNEHHAGLAADDRVIGQKVLDLVGVAHHVKDGCITPIAIGGVLLGFDLDMAQLNVRRVGQRPGA